MAVLTLSNTDLQFPDIEHQSKTGIVCMFNIKTLIVDIPATQVFRGETGHGFEEVQEFH